MNNALDEVKRAFQPYRLTKKKSITIIESTKGSYVIKEKLNNNISEAYSYLYSRNFDCFPKLEEELRSDINIFEYIEEIPTPREQKALDMMEIIASLHNKTTYYKEITSDKYKEIFENISDNINYTQNYYDNLYNILIEEIYPSPSNYLLLRNMYKIFEALDYARANLDEWYDNNKDTLKERVVLNHNNLETDHFIRGTKKALISWDKAKIDTPILDLIIFYQKEYQNYNFEPLIKNYLKNYPLKDSELKLFFIVISIPPIINVENSEIKKTKIISEKLDYVFKTETLIKSLSPNDGDK